MTSTMKVCNPLPQTGSLLAELVEEIAEKFQAGEAVDLEAFAAGHPEVAEQIRQLIPTVQVLAQLGRSAADGDPAAIALVSAAPAELGRLGDYRILREAGRGGMGIVYEAEQISLRRRVALKVLPFAAVLDPRQLQRFQNEAQAAAHLHHHHIVPAYGVGCERGIHYYAMQFIEGHSVAALIAEWRRWSGLDSSEQEAADTSAYELAGALASGARQPSPIAVEDANAAAAKHGRAADATIAAPRAGTSTDRSSNDPAYFHAIARLGVQAAKALEHAHEMGVIHRDIKPANLLVDMRGNLWITDFGLALSQNQASLTMTGDLVGTLRYMSPEQALANRGLIDH